MSGPIPTPTDVAHEPTVVAAMAAKALTRCTQQLISDACCHQADGDQAKAFEANRMATRFMKAAAICGRLAR